MVLEYLFKPSIPIPRVLRCPEMSRALSLMSLNDTCRSVASLSGEIQRFGDLDGHPDASRHESATDHDDRPLIL